jgi:hypothetical protein
VASLRQACQAAGSTGPGLSACAWMGNWPQAGGDARWSAMFGPNGKGQPQGAPWSGGTLLNYGSAMCDN